MRAWTSTKRFHTLSVLILTLGACVLLGSANVLALSEHRPEDRGQSVNHQYEVTAQSAKPDNPSAFRQPFIDPPRAEKSESAAKDMNWQNPEWWNAQRVTAAATVAYVGVSILLWFAILSQTKAIKRTANATQKSAEATALNARAVISLELPRIFHHVELLPEGHGLTKDSLVQIECRNYGRTPARLSQICMDLAVERVKPILSCK